MISLENAETAALKLYKASFVIGEAVNLINSLASFDILERDGNIFTSEPEAYETALLKGEEVMVALRTIAMRLDRAVMIKSMKEDLR